MHTVLYFGSAVVPVCLLLMLLFCKNAGCGLAWVTIYERLCVLTPPFAGSLLCNLYSWCTHAYGTYELLISIL
jgi:hypothetical protein